MFDSKLCDRPFSNTLTSLPLVTNWWQFGWRKQLLLVVIVILAFLGVRWIIQHKRLRYWLTSPKKILLLFGFSATLPLIFAVAAKGLVIFLPTDSGAAAQAIIVLGRGEEFRQQRVNIAAELWQARRAPIIFTSGRGDAAAMIGLLEEKGIPNRVLDGDNCSLTTEENAIVTAAILLPQSIQRILLITDEAHMLRSLLVFRAKGFTVIPHVTPVPSYLDGNWVGKTQKILLTLREYAGLVGYGLRGLYRPQHSPELKSPDLVNLVQQAQQYGQQQRLQNLRLNW